VSAIALLAIGCSDESTAPDPGAVEETNLEDPFGGFTSQDEQPAFGDADLAESVAAEVPYEDVMVDDPEIKRWREAHHDSVHVYAVTLLWGMLTEDPASTIRPDDPPDVPVTDWTGYVRVNRGGVLLRSVVAFEPEDRIIPRLHRRQIGWISHTTVSFDGIRILVYQHFFDGQSGETDSLTVVAGDHRWDFLVNDLAELDYEESVDAIGNKFALRSLQLVPTVCAHGFLGGSWAAPESSTGLGAFHGRWVSRDGSVAGFVRGHYGIDRAGRKVLFGKYVDLDGDFRGFLRGHWEEVGTESLPGHSDRDRHHGWFRGDWIDSNERLLGRLRGAWRSVPGEGAGFFEGSWTGVCLSKP
jgi:hypothetical protein